MKRLQRIDKEMSGKAREDFAAFIPDGDIAAFARDLGRRIQQEFTPTMALLRSPAFQDLLMNYARRQRVFIVSDATRDVVSSEWLVRGADGTEYKPADYLIAFAEFVRAHQNDIEAIAVLLKRPRNWSPGTLQELRQKLSAAPQRFTLDNLQKAHAIRDRKGDGGYHFDGETRGGPATRVAQRGGAGGQSLRTPDGRPGVQR